MRSNGNQSNSIHANPGGPPRPPLRHCTADRTLTPELSFQAGPYRVRRDADGVDDQLDADLEYNDHNTTDLHDCKGDEAGEVSRKPCGREAKQRMLATPPPHGR